jgi:hypothetical protein
MRVSDPADDIGRRFLTLFDADESRAEQQYLELFRKLTRYFEWRHHADPEALAQETVLRAMRHVARTLPNRNGPNQPISPSPHWRSVSRDVSREAFIAGKHREQAAS